LFCIRVLLYGWGSGAEFVGYITREILDMGIFLEIILIFGVEG
jgi:hypothetical protein